jgi:hypothetical protein
MNVKLHWIAQFVLFVSSYSPLFIIVIVRQFVQNYEYLNWGGLTQDALIVFIERFGISTFLLVLTAFGMFGYNQTLKNITRNAENGFPVTIVDVKNKNGEAIGYIATYIIPFAFQELKGLYEFISLVFLFVIIYRIYINSTLLLINPVLSIRYAIYEVEFLENSKTKNGLILSSNKYIQEGDHVKLYEIGPKLYYSINNN